MATGYCGLMALPDTLGQYSAKTQSQRPDLLQPVSVSRAQLDRTVLQQDQAMSACRDPIRQNRGQLSGIHQARINPHLATCFRALVTQAS
jgi:hypothetical protein